jgi:hypothetical protein
LLKKARKPDAGILMKLTLKIDMGRLKRFSVRRVEVINFSFKLAYTPSPLS